MLQSLSGFFALGAVLAEKLSLSFLVNNLFLAQVHLLVAVRVWFSFALKH
jgi:hypothetical protein